jgi:AraC family transcriptional regulator of arabinose operon
MTAVRTSQSELPTGGQRSPEALGNDRGLEGLFGHVRCTVLQAGWFPCAPTWRLPPRIMPNHIVWVCVGGGAEYLIGGQAYSLKPGGVLISPPRVLQEAHHDPSDPLRVYTVHFVARLYGVLDMPALCPLPTLLTPEPQRMAEIVEVTHCIVAELAAARPAFALAANGACAHLLALLWREAEAASSGSGLKRTPRAAEVTRLAPAFHAIHSGYAAPVSLEALAATVHLHPVYFSTLFKRVTGLPPLRYVSQYRLDRARELLLSTTLSVREIARQTGHRDPFYLSRVFRRAEGLSPTEYRCSRQEPGLP